MAWSDIPGWSGFLQIYDKAIEEAEDGDIIVEIGVAFGRSVAYLARRVIDSGKKITIYAIDPWVDDWWMPPNTYPLDAPRPTWGGEHAEWARSLGGPFSAFVYCMRTYAPEELERINVVRGYADHVRGMIRRSRRSLRCVLIDGNHNYDQVRLDILGWRGMVREGGILAGDDYSPDFPGVVRAVDELVPERMISGTTWWARR